MNTENSQQLNPEPTHPISSNLESQLPQSPPKKRFYLLIIFVIVLIFAGGIGIFVLGTINNQPLPNSDTVNALKSSPTPNTPDVNDIARKQSTAFLYAYLRQYFADNSTYPKNLEQLVPRYTLNIPTDPVTNESYIYNPSDDLKSFTLTATLTNGETYSGDSLEQERVMKAIIQVDIAQLTSAIGFYKADNGSYPENLSVLVPNSLKYIKRNPISLKPYGYQPQNDKYIITTEYPGGETYTQTFPINLE